MLGTTPIRDVPSAGPLRRNASRTRTGCPARTRAATIEAATLLGLATDLGTLERGKIADVLLVEGDPIAEPSLWRDPSRISMVVQAGRVVADRRAR